MHDTSTTGLPLGELRQVDQSIRLYHQRRETLQTLGLPLSRSYLLGSVKDLKDAVETLHKAILR